MSVAGRTVTGVNRTDRLYALIEELRAISPRYVEVAELAARFGVSRRTIARDLSMLRDSGLPIASAPRMGYRLDITPAPPPLSFTTAEALVIAMALGRLGDERTAAEAAGAMGKLAAAMSASVSGDERSKLSAVAREIEHALLRRHALRIEYTDGKGALTSREVEPQIFLGGRGGLWYLVAWCRLREDVRVFRLDRIATASVLAPLSGPEETETAGGQA